MKNQLPIKTSSIKYFILLILCFIFQISQAQNDTIILKNNDKIIGKIKAMNKGVAIVKTSYSDSDFKITWVDIISVRSKQTFLIILSDGTRVNSSLYTKRNELKKVTLIEADSFTTEIKDIVYIKPIKNDFLSRLSTAIALGYNFTKSNNLQQFSLSSNLSYTTYKWQLSGSYNSVRSNQDNVQETHRTDAHAAVNFFLKNDWYYSTSANFLSNDEQKLKLRSTIKLGMGKYLIHTNRLNFAGGAGLGFNNEEYTDELKTNRTSAEAYGTLLLNIFDLSDLSLNTDATIYPSLTERKRYRLDYNLNLKYNLPLDFFIKLGLTYNFDSKPVEGTSHSDYVFQSSFGWEFN